MLALLVGTSFAFVSCGDDDEDDTTTQSADNNSIVGTWRLESEYWYTYYTFCENGVIYMYMGEKDGVTIGSVVKGTYTYSNNQVVAEITGTTITMSVTLSGSNATFEYAGAKTPASKVNPPASIEELDKYFKEGR